MGLFYLSFGTFISARFSCISFWTCSLIFKNWSSTSLRILNCSAILGLWRFSIILSISRSRSFLHFESFILLLIELFCILIDGLFRISFAFVSACFWSEHKCRKFLISSWFSGGVFFDLPKSAILHFWPTPNLLYYTSDLLARGFTAAIWTCGRSARPLTCPSRDARPPDLDQLAAALGPEIVPT